RPILLSVPCGQGTFGVILEERDFFSPCYRNPTRGSDSNGEKNNDLQGHMCSVGAACRLPGRMHGGQQQADQGKTSALLRHERPPMTTVGSRESVSTPQGVGIKPTGHNFAPTRRVGLSTFPPATDP